MQEKRWFHPVNRMDVEKALDSGMLYVPAGKGKYWLARRNGATKKWKTRPDHYRIPIKYGLKNCASIEHTTALSLLRVAGSREDAEMVGATAEQ